MSNIWVRFRVALSRTLDPAEREAVYGDFIELALTNRQAVKSLLGLVVRRQLRLWRAWNPWIALVAVVLPICPLLVSQSYELDGGIWQGIQIVEMWLHHGIRYETGLTPAANWAGFCFRAMALITWSWGNGFALGRISRRTVWVSAGLFFGLYLVTATATEPVFYKILLPIWLAWLPLLMSFPFVLVPAYFGICHSRRSRHIRLPWIVLLTVWTTIVSGLSLWTKPWIQAAMENWSRGAPALSLSQLAQSWVASKIGISEVIMTAVVTVPLVYVLGKDAFLHKPRVAG